MPYIEEKVDVSAMKMEDMRMMVRWMGEEARMITM